MSEAEMSDFEW